MRVDTDRLRGKIVERGFTQECVANEIPMNKSTFSRKMKSSGLEFSIGEMHKIVAILNLSKEEAGKIFLS